MFGYKRKYDEAVLIAASGEEALRRQCRIADELKAENSTTRIELNREIQWLRAELNVANANTAEAQDRLARIIASETPRMAGVGRKLVDIAKGLR